MKSTETIEADITATLRCPVVVGQIINKPDGTREIVTWVGNNQGELNVITEVLAGKGRYYLVDHRNELVDALGRSITWSKRTATVTR